ncbi:hypothetical protein AGLY_009619 [Aphis glycines]|uniref:Uncharacterized protein n=1 Tax=Aphis glycines TaxID=307491 RepID=A0A6G0TIK7_APHGL|nr:hypothetical protein AGLY_009619 [Aphis glycines]
MCKEDYSTIFISLCYMDVGSKARKLLHLHLFIELFSVLLLIYFEISFMIIVDCINRPNEPKLRVNCVNYDILIGAFNVCQCISPNLILDVLSKSYISSFPNSFMYCSNLFQLLRINIQQLALRTDILQRNRSHNQMELMKWHNHHKNYQSRPYPLQLNLLQWSMDYYKLICTYQTTITGLHGLLSFELCFNLQATRYNNIATGTLNLLKNCYHENLLFDHYGNLIQWNGAKTLIPKKARKPSLNAYLAEFLVGTSKVSAMPEKFYISNVKCYKKILGIVIDIKTCTEVIANCDKKVKSDTNQAAIFKKGSNNITNISDEYFQFILNIISINSVKKMSIKSVDSKSGFFLLLSIIPAFDKTCSLGTDIAGTEQILVYQFQKSIHSNIKTNSILLKLVNKNLLCHTSPGPFFRCILYQICYRMISIDFVANKIGRLNC